MRCGHITMLPDHVEFVLQQSADEIGDLSTDNRKILSTSVY